MAIVEHSRTARFILQYDDQIAPARQLAQTLGETIEGDFYFLRRYLPVDQGVSPDAFERHPTVVIFVDASSKTALNLSDQDAASIPGRGGARNFILGPSRGGVIWLNAFGATNNPLTPDFARFLFIAEMSEQLMGYFTWDPSSSRGEALSRALAEQFFPNAAYAAECISIAPWVNGWLNSSPRYDYLGANPSPTLANKTLGSDTDGLGYGCGILFINYLRSQLGYSLDAICQAGGTTFVDTYKNLTGRSDDPLIAMNALLAKHYDGSFFNLRDNDPFPLLESDARRVTLGFASTSTDVPSHARVTRHIVHVSPFITCPAKDYSFRRVARAVTWTVTATAIGFALPQFKWSLSNRVLFSSAGAIDVAVTFDVPDPAHPRAPKAGSGNARFGWTHANLFARGLSENALVVTNESFDGDYHVDLTVEVSETYAGDAATVVQASIDFEALRIVYETRFYEDGKACEKRFLSAVPSLQQTVDLVLGRPDPAKGRDLASTIRAVDAIRSEIEHIRASDAELADQAGEYAATQLQIAPSLLLGAKETIA